MRLSTTMFPALLVLLFFGCNDSKTMDVSLGTGDFKQEENSQAADTSTLPVVVSDQDQARYPDNEIVETGWDKKIIKTATLNLEVKNYGRYYSLLYPSVKRSGGYVAQEDQSETEYKTENIVTIKVPVAQFDEAVKLLLSDTVLVKLVDKKIGSEDVTRQVVDTKSRLESKRQVRIRYLELLKQAKNMEEVLQVQNEINDLQEQIELATGRLTYLNQSAAYSTIHLTFFQVMNPSASTVTEPSFIIKLANAFQQGLDFIKQFILGLITIWPLLIVFAGIWFVFRKWKISKVKTTI